LTATGIGTIFFSHSSREGTMTFAFLEYARANALELCPSACWANRSGIPTVLASSDRGLGLRLKLGELNSQPFDKHLGAVVFFDLRHARKQSVDSPVFGHRTKVCSAGRQALRARRLRSPDATTMFGGAFKMNPPVMVVPSQKNLKLRVVSLPIIS
jgi:hypothetical protein